MTQKKFYDQFVKLQKNVCSFQVGSEEKCEISR